MAKPSEIKDWEAKRAGIVGLGERSFHKSYYPQLRQNVERLERFHTVLDQTTDFVILVALPDGTRCSAYQVTAPADANDEQLTHCLMARFA